MMVFGSARFMGMGSCLAAALEGLSSENQRGDAPGLEGRCNKASTKGCDQRSKKQIAKHFSLSVQ
ncbi:hypothetical protein D3C71_1934700 [compost metagenome]